MKIHYFGHSTFALSDKEHAIIIDPFIKGNPHMRGRSLPADLHFSHILLTHGHSDHAGDCESLAKNHGAVIVANFELAALLAQKGLKTHACALGGKLEFPWGWARQVPAIHSSSYNGQYAGVAVGYVINIGGFTIYHAGDTCLFGDMALIGRRYKIDTALLPIGGNFTMDIEEAVEAVAMLKPKYVVPMHYNTMPIMRLDPQEFKSQAEAASQAQVRIMQAGDIWEL